jgi:beta-lactamase regulating signal transducer with metallopeptidase domain
MIANLFVFIENAGKPVSMALLHSLWQGALVAIILSAVLFVLRGRAPRLRYAMSCIGLLAVFVLAIATIFYQGRGAESFQAESSSMSGLTEQAGFQSSPAEISVIEAAADFNSESGHSAQLPALAPWIFSIWFLGVVMLSFYHIRGWRRAGYLVGHETCKMSDEWRERCARLSSRLSISRPVRLLKSSLVKVPCVVGWLRPAILVPVSVLSGLRIDQLESILAHELAHIRRHDILINNLQTAMETLLFFNPAVWWISRQIRIAREHCCDDITVSICGDSMLYVRALADMEEIRAGSPSFAMASNGGSLLHRISRLVGQPSKSMRPKGLSFSLFILATLLVLWLSPVIAFDSNDSEDQSEKREVVEFKAQDDDLRGTWKIKPSKYGNQIRLKFEAYGSSSTFGFSMDEADDFIRETEAGFELIRDAGTFYCEGELAKDGDKWKGSGDCYFRADPEYIREMEKLGFKTPSDSKVFELAIHDVTLDFARGIIEAGYSGFSLDRLIELHIHDVSPEYMKELAELGYKDIKLSRLIEMRIHDVEPEYIRELNALGYTNIKPSRLIEMRIHDVDPEFIRELAEAGYKDIETSKLIEMHIHDVEPEFIRELSDLGYSDLSISRLVEMQIHDVDARFIRKLAQLGYTDIKPSKLIEMKIHDATPSYIAELMELGYKDLSPSQLVEFRIHDVTPAFIRKLAEHGYTNLPPEKLVEYKIHGIRVKLDEL